MAQKQIVNVPVPKYCQNGAPPAFRTAPPTPDGHVLTTPDGTPDLQQPLKQETVTATTICNIRAYQMSKKNPEKTPPNPTSVAHSSPTTTNETSVSKKKGCLVANIGNLLTSKKQKYDEFSQEEKEESMVTVSTVGMGHVLETYFLVTSKQWEEHLVLKPLIGQKNLCVRRKESSMVKTKYVISVISVRRSVIMTSLDATV